MRFMRWIGFLLTGLVVFLQPVVAATRLCGILDVDESLIKKNSAGVDQQRKVCSEWMENKTSPIFDVEVNFSSLNPDVPNAIRMTRSQTTTPWIMPTFIRLVPGNRRPKLDRKMLNEAFNSWPVYESKAREMFREGGSVSVAANFSQRKTLGGSYLIVELSYFNKLTKETWREGYFSFYKPHEISVSYSSNSLLSDSPTDRNFLKKMKKLFISMRVVE